MGEYTSEYHVSAGPDEIVHKLNDNSLTVYNNTKLEDCLNVITVHTNPNHFKRRRFLSLNSSVIRWKKNTRCASVYC